MGKLIDQILKNTSRDYFSDTELQAWVVSATNNSREGMIRRAIAKQDLIHVRKGLYALDKRYQRQGINLHELAQSIYGPSYVSFESALSYHGLIPEAVYTMTSATFKRSRSFKTPLGLFIYKSVPRITFLSAVQRIGSGHRSFFMASPVKAIADLIYEKKHDWTGMEPLIESLRIDEEDLALFDMNEIESLKTTYPSRRVRRFLTGLLKDLKK